jgi:hypothetical protein
VGDAALQDGYASVGPVLGIQIQVMMHEPSSFIHASGDNIHECVKEISPQIESSFRNRLYYLIVCDYTLIVCDYTLIVSGRPT